MWKIDTSLFLHPLIGNHLPQIINDPKSIHPDQKANREIKGMVEPLSETFRSEAIGLWKFNGRALKREESEQIFQSVQDRLNAVARLGEYDFFSTIANSWEFIAYRNVGTAFPTLSSPLESVLNHLHGAMYLYSRWGSTAFMDKAFVSMFWGFAEDAKIPRESFLREINDQYRLEIRPGIYEAFGGIHYSLIFQGRTKLSGNVDIPVASVGVIRRPEGYAIVSLQGGPRLRRIKIFREGQYKELLQESRTAFGGDPREWLAREVIGMLRQEDPTGKLYMRRAERISWLFGEHKEKAETLPLTELERALTASAQNSEKEIIELEKVKLQRTLTTEEASLLSSHQTNIMAIQETVRKISRLNKLANRLGFQPEEIPESSWLISK